MRAAAPGLALATLVSMLMLTLAANVPASTPTPGATMPKPPPTTIADARGVIDAPAGAIGRDRAEIAGRFARTVREATALLEHATGDRAGKLCAARERAALGVLQYSDDPATRADAEAVLAELERARLERQVAEILEVVRELVPARMRDELGAELERRAVAELARRRTADRSRTR